MCRLELKWKIRNCDFLFFFLIEVSNFSVFKKLFFLGVVDWFFCIVVFVVFFVIYGRGRFIAGNCDIFYVKFSYVLICVLGRRFLLKSISSWNLLIFLDWRIWLVIFILNFGYIGKWNNVRGFVFIGIVVF